MPTAFANEAVALVRDQSTWQEADKSAPKRTLKPQSVFKSLKAFDRRAKVDLKPATDLGWEILRSEDEIRGEKRMVYRCSHSHLNGGGCPFRVL